MRNSTLIEHAKDIVIAKLASSDAPADSATGKNVADFMQAVYDKLVEHNDNENN